VSIRIEIGGRCAEGIGDGGNRLLAGPSSRSRATTALVNGYRAPAGVATIHFAAALSTLFTKTLLASRFPSRAKLLRLDS